MVEEPVGLSHRASPERYKGVQGMEAWDDHRLLADRSDARASFAVFYRRHVVAVLASFARSGVSASLAGDLTAETFTAAMLARYRFRPDRETARPWLLSIAARKLVDAQRRGAREERARRRLGLERPDLSDQDRADYAALADTDGPALSALDDLPEPQRSVVRARVLHEQSYAQISRDLGVTQVAARQHHSRGLAALRRGLKEQRP